MFDEVAPILESRKNDKLIQGRIPSSHNPQAFFHLHGCDWGVIRNSGRSGARFAPNSIINHFTHFQKTLMPELTFSTSQSLARSEHFATRQEEDSAQIAKYLKDYPSALHIQLGGGHDHIYSLLKAISTREHDQIIVINLDAHCDTRIDEFAHSGTPFRQFDEQYQGELLLLQVGINRFANSTSTLSQLKNGKMMIIDMDQIESATQQGRPEEILNLIKRTVQNALPKGKTHVVFSLDLDALDQSVFPYVSAINPRGLSQNFVLGLLHNLFPLGDNATAYLGLYEYNPLMDYQGGAGAKVCAHLCHEFLRSNL